MSNKEKILKLLHKIFRDDKITNEIAKVTGYKMDNIELQINEIRDQNFINSATWGLDIFEKELGIDNVSSKSYTDRRGVIQAKWRGNGKLTLELIKQTVDSFINGEVEVTFTGIIEIDFSSRIGRPPNMEDVYEAIENIKPAHLAINYTFRYRLTKEAMQYTNWELQACTHYEIRTESAEVITEKIKNRYYDDVLHGGYTCNKENPERKLIRPEFWELVHQELLDNGYDDDGNAIQ